MKTLSQLINEQLVFESFEDFCFYKKIENVSLTVQKEFFKWNYFGFDSYDNFVIDLYERLGESLSPDFVYNRLLKEFPNIKDYAIANNREDDIVLKFKTKEGFENNPKFISILNFCNWYINSIKAEGNDKLNNIITYNIEPKHPTNYSDFIYKNCNGIIYKIVNKNSLQKILKYGLKPKRTTDIKDKENNRNYFIANTNLEKIKNDIVSTINEINVFKNNKKQLSIIEIDLIKLKKEFDINIQGFIDQRMNTKTYWTMEFIPPSCITDVTENFTDILL